MGRPRKNPLPEGDPTLYAMAKSKTEDNKP